MPQPRRRVKEREPRAVRLAEGILGLLWLWAVFEFATNGSINLIQMRLTDHINPTPLLVAVGLSVPIVAALIFVVRLQTRASQSIVQLQAMSPDLFEDWVAARFRELGYAVRVAGSQGDHGVDLLAEKPGELAVVQCKNYKAWSVGEPILRDLFGAMVESKRREPAQTPSATVISTAAICPKCSSILVERRNRATGEVFLACPRYPACRHTQPVA